MAHIEIYVNYNEYDFTVVVEDFDYTPEQIQTFHDPGFAAEVEPTEGYVICETVPENEEDCDVIRWAKEEDAFFDICEALDEKISEAIFDHMADDFF